MASRALQRRVALRRGRSRSGHVRFLALRRVQVPAQLLYLCGLRLHRCTRGSSSSLSTAPSFQASAPSAPPSSLASSSVRPVSKPSGRVMALPSAHQHRPAKMNMHVEGIRHHIPTPKAMRKASVSEAIAAPWPEAQRVHGRRREDDEHDVYFEPSGKRRRG